MQPVERFRAIGLVEIIVFSEDVKGTFVVSGGTLSTVDNYALPV